MNIKDRKAYLRGIERVIAQGLFADNWASLANYQPLKWYQDAKFGIFIQWGVYAVPAFGSEGYSRNMYIQGSREYEHHLAVYGAHKDFGYKDFIPMFKAERFDPEAWAALFERAGAKYVVPVAEHHDGFQMYRSELSKWNAAHLRTVWSTGSSWAMGENLIRILQAKDSEVIFIGPPCRNRIITICIRSPR